MRFYSFSLFSWMVYGVAIFIAIVLLRLVWTKLLRLKVGNPLYWALIAAIVIAPWGEELWIAYNFGRLCRKDAGLFIYKTVKVDGFYDDISAWGPLRLARYGYRFVESRDTIHKKLMRVERADEAARDSALAWYAKQHSGEKRSEKLYIVHPINESEKVVVSPNGVDVWRVMTIEHPTARYRYVRTRYRTRVAHKVSESEYVVLDSETKNILGRYRNYYRGPYWFSINWNATKIPCAETGTAVQQVRALLLYDLVLKPGSAK